MIRKIDHKQMGRGQHGWLDSHFHFSFAEYYNPSNINFGALRVINDDIVQPNRGFELHPHQNMEIISYVVDGKLTHQDSMGNKHTLGRGEVQYMSAGTGVYHSEHNLEDTPLRFLQIWIFPNKEGYTPNYGDFRFKWEDRKNKWLEIASNENDDAPITIHQDVHVYASELDQDNEIKFTVAKGRQAYLVQIEGNSVINNQQLETRDGLESIEEDLHIKAQSTSHFLVIEMSKE